MNRFILIILSLVLINYFLHYYYIRSYKKYFPPDIVFPIKEEIELPIVEKEKDIPKVIYRTYKRDKIHLFQKALDKTKAFLPDYEQIIYDDEMILEFIKENFSERILNAYNSINPLYGPARADFFRYLVIYLKGGIYLDIKNSVVGNIKPLLKKYKDKLIVSKGKNFNSSIIPTFHIDSLMKNNHDWSYFSDVSFGECNNWVIISPKGNLVLVRMIKQMVSNIEEGVKNKNYYSSGEKSVLALTGPIVYSRIIASHKNKQDYVLLSNGLKGLVKYDYVNHKKILSDNHYKKFKDNRVII